MAHSKEAMAKHSAMPQFNEGHWEKKPGDIMVENGKYSQGEMSNPEHLKASVDALASYAKKHQMKY
jgi:hypothetical protein